MWMNEWDVQDMRLRLHDTDNCPNLRDGADTLFRLMAWTNQNSDGWPYWQKPARAAARLMDLLQAADRFDPQDCTEAELKKAYTPIKSFLTRQGVDHPVVFR